MGLTRNGWEPDEDGLEGYVTEGRAEELFAAGAQQMREMLARFVEATDPVIANSIRLNWPPSLGPDPGRPESIDFEPWNH
jgi:hypothetical protein